MNPIGTAATSPTVTSLKVPQSILDSFKASIGVVGMRNLDAILAQIPDPLEITLDSNNSVRPMMRLSYANNNLCIQCCRSIMNTKLPQSEWSPKCTVEGETVVMLSFEANFCFNFPEINQNNRNPFFFSIDMYDEP
ncbi:MAG: hypothetical protein JSR37_02790 [Verrucomicrobia bacterium]|nr:hypothetical protein [Verrucomicrobiota bacterium]MBS0636103.1 hypothetical protein [Verrucomicrobiota bacterium]